MRESKIPRLVKDMLAVRGVVTLVGGSVEFEFESSTIDHCFCSLSLPHWSLGLVVSPSFYNFGRKENGRRGKEEKATVFFFLLFFIVLLRTENRGERKLWFSQTQIFSFVY